MPTPKSTIEGLIWPALPGTTGRRLLALLYQFEHSQWWDPEELLRHQFRQLTTLVRHAHDTVPFYRQRLEAAGIDRKQALTPERWRRIPVLSRKEVQGAFEALQSRRLPKAHGRTGEGATSGATAMPVTVKTTALAMLFWMAFSLREHQWHRRELDAKLAIIRPAEGAGSAYPSGGLSPSWGAGPGAVFATGPCVTLDITTGIEHQVEWLRRQDPGYLVTYPSNLEGLVAFCAERGIRLPGLREARTLAEVLSPELREACRAAWGVPVTEVYSSQEVGHIALQCPSSELLHVQSEGVLVEVLDDRGRPCRPGEVGQVVVTPLHNFAMPLIRYALGDLAEAGERCACGRGLPVLVRILGRVRDAVRLPTGERYWPRLRHIRKTLMDFGGISQFQIVQRTLEELELRLVGDRRLTPAEEERLREVVRDQFRYPFNVGVSYHDEIPRGPGGKFEVIRSEID